MKYLAFAASHRPESYNRRLLALALAALPGDAVVDLASYEEIELPGFNDAAREAGRIPAEAERVAERILQADGLIIAMPEYNWSLPGSLKNMIDWVSHFRPVPFAGRTALLLCATPGKRGGVQGIAHLRSVLEALGSYVHPDAFCLGDAALRFEGTTLNDPEAAERLSNLTCRFCDFTERLRR